MLHTTLTISSVSTRVQVDLVNLNKHKNIYETHAAQGEYNVNIWGGRS